MDTVFIFEIILKWEIHLIKNYLINRRFDHFLGSKKKCTNRIAAKRQINMHFKKNFLLRIIPWPILNSLYLFFYYFFSKKISFSHTLISFYLFYSYLRKYKGYI